MYSYQLHRPLASLSANKRSSQQRPVTPPRTHPERTPLVVRASPSSSCPAPPRCACCRACMQPHQLPTSHCPAHGACTSPACFTATAGRFTASAPPAEPLWPSWSGPKKLLPPPSASQLQESGSGPEEALDVALAEGRAAAGALAVAGLQVAADALRAEHVPALGDDHVFLQQGLVHKHGEPAVPNRRAARLEQDMCQHLVMAATIR